MSHSCIGDDFRPIYGDVSIIRSWLSEAPVLLLSATITKATFDKILTLLPHHEFITMVKLPDRYCPKIFTKSLNKYRIFNFNGDLTYDTLLVYV